jgi:hypothetical protein
MGATVSNYSAADGDGNGVVQQPDYEVWRGNFGATGAAAATVRTLAMPAGESSFADASNDSPREVATAQLFSANNLEALRGVEVSNRTHGYVSQAGPIIESDAREQALLYLIRQGATSSFGMHEPFSEQYADAAELNKDATPEDAWAAIDDSILGGVVDAL